MLTVATVTVLGIDVGPWSGWFSGILTAVGIYLALKKETIRFEFHIFTSQKDGLVFNVTNRSGFDVQAQAIGVKIRKHWWSKDEIYEDVKYYTSKERQKLGVLKPNVMWRDSNTWSNIPELAERKWCYAVLFVVASDGVTYHKRAKRVKTAMFEDDFLKK